jgi:hypothetical protein
MIRAELEPGTRARDRPKWPSSSSSSDNSFCYASRARTRFFSSCRARARALLFVKRAEPEQAIPAQDRLVYTPSWGVTGSMECLFCHARQECRDHLFFEYRFNRRMWKAVMKACLITDLKLEWEQVFATVQLVRIKIKLVQMLLVSEATSLQQFCDT